MRLDPKKFAISFLCFPRRLSPENPQFAPASPPKIPPSRACLLSPRQQPSSQPRPRTHTPSHPASRRHRLAPHLQQPAPDAQPPLHPRRRTPCSASRRRHLAPHLQKPSPDAQPLASQLQQQPPPPKHPGRPNPRSTSAAAAAALNRGPQSRPDPAARNQDQEPPAAARTQEPADALNYTGRRAASRGGAAAAINKFLPGYYAGRELGGRDCSTTRPSPLPRSADYIYM